MPKDRTNGNGKTFPCSTEQNKKLDFNRREKILLHLDNFKRFENQIEVPLAISQEGIAKATRIALPNLSITLKRLEEDHLIYEKLCHIQRRKRSKKAYFLTDVGIKEIGTFKKGLESLHIDFADRTPQLKHFFGRKKEIREFRDWLESDTLKVLVVSGIAGIGKTAYLTKAVEPYRDSMHIFWHRFNEWSTLRGFLTRLSDFLSEAGKERLGAYLRAKEVIDINEISIILTNDMGYHNALLIFDDYHKVKDKEDFAQMFGALRELLEQIVGSKAIVIGREVPRFFYDEREVSIKKTVKELKLGGLDVASSLKLLKKRGIIGNKGKRLYELCRGHPLTLELMSKSERFETQDAIKRFVEEEIFSNLKQEERIILEISSVFRFPIYPTAYLEIARACRNKEISNDLPIGLLPFHPENTDKQVEEISYEVIDSLVKKSLLQISKGICDIHDLLREFLYRRIPECLRKTYHEKIAVYYLRNSTESPQTTLEAQHHFLMAEEYQQVVELLVKTGETLINRGYWQEILEIVEKIPFRAFEPKYRSEILLLKGHIYYIRGELDKAFENYIETIQSLKETGVKKGEAEVYNWIGEIMLVRNEWNEGLKYFRKALEMSQLIDDFNAIGNAHRGIGLIWRYRGEPDRALEELEKAQEYFTKTGNERALAKIYLIMGTIKQQIGEDDKRIEYQRKALSILKMIEDKKGTIVAFESIAMAWHIKGKFNKAIEWFERAITFTEEIGNIRGLAYNLSNAAEAYAEIGDMQKALGYCKKAEPIFEKLDEKLMIANIQMVYGLIHTKNKNWELSERYFKKALEISIKAQVPNISAQVYLHYGRMLVKSGRNREAKEQYDKSLEIWEELRNTERIELVKKEMALL